MGRGGWEGTVVYPHMGDVGKVQGFRCVKGRGKYCIFWYIKLFIWLVSAINLIASSYVGEMYAGNLTSESGLDNRGLFMTQESGAPLFISQVTSISHNGDPEHCLLSGEHNPVWENPKHILIFCNFVEGAPMPRCLQEPYWCPWHHGWICTTVPHLPVYISMCLSVYLFGPLKQHLIGCLHCVTDEVWMAVHG